MPRPLIGLCAPTELADQGAWKDDPSDIVPAALVNALQAAGLIVVLVSYDSAVEEDPDEVLRLLDGLALQAGGDERRFEQALAARASELGMPVARLDGPESISEFAKALSPPARSRPRAAPRGTSSASGRRSSP